MSKNIRIAIQELNRLQMQVTKLDPILALKFETLRSKILSIESNGDWREYYDVCREPVARSKAELADLLGVSIRTLYRHEKALKNRKSAGHVTMGWPHKT